MPTIAASQVPPPKSWDEFEDITLSAAKLRWDSTGFYRHGRQGQAQQGVDIWGHDGDRLIGVQCKNTVASLSLVTVEAEVHNAEAFEPALSHLYIATTMSRDGPLQKAVRQLSRERRQHGLFPVDILFWDDVCGDLAGDDDVFFKHYPQFRSGHDPAKDHDAKLFAELTALLNSDGVIGFLDQTNMAGFSFPEAKLEPLREFYYDWKRPEREFISPELEELKALLWAKADAYYEIIAAETYPTKIPGRQTVPPELEMTDPKRFRRIVNGLHGLAGEIVALHGQLVRTGKKLLIGSEYRKS